jgi:DNA-binding NarL/FixJ family response regulator
MIKIVIFEDNRHLRESMSMVINNTEGMACSGAFANGDNLIRDIVNSNPDLVIMDIDMPGKDGIACTRLIKLQFPKVKVLMQTVFEQNEKIKEAIHAGADGYILKKARPGELIDAIREASTDGVPLSPEVARKVLNLIKERASDSKNKQFDLTQRELEILHHLAEGRSYKAIAEELYISFSTVQSHIKHIYEKLDVNSKSEAVSKAFKNNLLDK